MAGAAVDNNLNTTTTFANDTVSQWMYGELLERSERLAVFDRYAKPVTLPAGWGNTVQFVRYERPGLTAGPLTEGVTPAGRNLVSVKITAQVDQFGDYFTLTDTAILQTFHGPFEEAVSMSGDQWGQLRDRESIRGLMRATNAYFAGGKTSVATLTANDVPSTTDVLTVVEGLRGRGAPTFTDDYICITDTANEADLIRDSTFTTTKQQQDQAPLERGQFLRWMGCTFVRSNQIPSFAANSSASATTGSAQSDSGNELVDATYRLNLVAADKYGQEFAIGTSITQATSTQVFQFTVPALITGAESYNVYASTSTAGTERLVKRGAVPGVHRLTSTGSAASGTGVAYATTGQLIRAIPASGVSVHMMFFLGRDYFANTKNGSMVPTLTAPTTQNRTTDSDPLGQRRKVGWKGWGKWGVILNENYGAILFAASRYTGYVTV